MLISLIYQQSNILTVLSIKCKFVQYNEFPVVEHLADS